MKHSKYQKLIFIYLLLFIQISYGAKIIYSVKGVEGKLYKNIINSIDSADNIQDLEETNPKIQYLNNIDTIKNLAKPYGYFFINIKPNLIKQDDNWYASYNINLGKRMVVTSVSTVIQPNKIAIPNGIIKKDDGFTLEKYQQSKDIMLANAKSNGFPNASIANSRVNIDLDKNTCDITFTLELGEIHRFGKVIYNTNKINHDFLNEFAPFTKGELFDKSKLPEFKNNLESSHLFTQVIAIPDFNHNTQIPINVNLELKPKKEYLIGVGFDTDEYVRGLFEMSNNLASPYGHTSKVYSEASTAELEIGFKYYVPGRNPVKDKYIYSIYLDTKNDQKVGTSNYIAASAVKSKKHNDLTLTHSMNLHYEKSTPNNSGSYYATLIYPKIGLTYSNHNNKTFPYTVKSKMISWYALAAAKTLGSSLNMLKSEVNANMNYNITKNISLYTKIQTGSIITSDFTDVPLTFQFTSGGSSSLRGYSYNSIGPNKVVELLNVELYHQIYDDWYVMLFYDIGNTFSKFQAHNFNVGTGPGILWKTPVGDAKLSIAQAITKQGKPWSIQFSFNPIL
jgi:translocation and assembly module TamA